MVEVVSLHLYISILEMYTKECFIDEVRKINSSI